MTIRTTARRAALWVPIALVLLAGCSDGPTTPDDGPVSLRISADVGAAVSLVVVRVTAPDITMPLAFTLPVVSGQINGTLTIPAGSDRTITVHVYDEGGIETHRGSTVIDLVAGTNPSLELRVFPLTGEQPIVVVITTITLAVSPTSHAMLVGETFQLTATITDGSGQPVSGTVGWATLDPAIATVDASGLVTAHGPGTVSIVATFGGQGAASTITVSVAASPALQPISTSLATPVAMAAPPGDGRRLFVLEVGGTIRLIKDGVVQPDLVLDIRPLVLSGGEQGLLGIAFHPDYQSNGFFYVNYTSSTGSQVVRYTISANQDVADPASAFPLLSVPQPAPNHNGGDMVFGPDGMLYIAFGDGGGAAARVNAQDLGSLLGKILRIDVDGGTPYAIPADNPFVGQSGARGEIWAMGLRNPWRFSFDRATGDMYIADVGEGAWEEVNFVAAGSSGGQNFGWPIMEGSACFGGTTCNPAGLTTPIFAYSHASGGCSITGGYVYRGGEISGLSGHYIYSDLCAGWIRSFRYENGIVSDETDWSGQLAPGNQITSFGQGNAGELYILRLAGSMHAIVPATP